MNSSAASGCGLFALISLIFIFNSVSSFWNGLTRPMQFGVVVVLILAVVGAAYYFIDKRARRKAAWELAMATWQSTRQLEPGATTRNLDQLSPAALEEFAAKLFEQMGYVVKHTGQSGDHGVDVHLVNPNRQSELVQCKQWKKPVGEPEVRDLAGAMAHENALRGFIIAPGGFTEAARKWASGKPIVLADKEEIDRLVFSAYGKS